MSEKYIIGLDGGTQSTKVAIYDLKGNLICMERQRLKPLYTPKPGVAEHPDDDVWDSIVSACNRIMKKFKGNPQDIIGLGLCSIRTCCLHLKEDGTLSYPALNWMDKRAYEPRLKLSDETKYVCATNGYVTHRFTGNFYDSASLYVNYWPIDMDTWQWSEDPEVLEQFGIKREMLLDLKMPGELLGHVTKEAAELTGVPEGLPVIATANDKAVEGLGSGIAFENELLLALGTYTSSMMYGPENHGRTPDYWTNMACIPHKFLYESNGIRKGMWSISWIRDLFADGIKAKAEERGVSLEQILEDEAKLVSPGSDGLMTVLEWEAPKTKPHRRGMMIGFDARHKRGHMYRSFLEAIAYTTRNNTFAMCDALGVKINKVAVGGGGSNSDLLMQIIADVYGIPATRNLVNEPVSLGSAICAAVGTGVYSDFPTAIKNMVHQKDIFYPDTKVSKFYNEINKEIYKNLPDHTDKILQKAHKYFAI